MRRAIVTTLALACIAASCGGGDDDDQADATTPPAAASAADQDVAAADTVVADDGGGAAPAADDGGGAEYGGHGGISFAISGEQEKSGAWAFVPEASSYSNGWWAMSFTDTEHPVGTIITLSLDPTNQNITFGDPDLTITGMPPMCTFDITSQDAGGASGTVECSHLTAIPMTGDVFDAGLSANFDATTGAGSMPDAAQAAPAAASSDAAVATEPPAAAGAGGGEATITVSGGHDANATWTFSPETSIFNNSWVMTFDDPTNPITAGGPFVTMSLAPDQPNLSLSDGLITIIDAAGQCDLQLDHQDAHGAAGSMSCSGVSAMGATDPVDITITFDGTV